MNPIDPIGRCRICGNDDLRPVLDLGSQALTGVFPRSREEVVPSLPLELVRCAGDPDRTCGLVQLRHSAPAQVLYGGAYGYRSALNRAMVAHLHGLVRRLLAWAAPAPGDVVLDIGSNDGTLLKGYPDLGLMRVGMDPTAARFADGYPEGALAIPDFFSADRFLAATGGRRAKLVTSVAMFYDLEDPQGFMNQVRAALDDQGVWLFEQSYLPSMLATRSFDTVCHEHLEYYALRQIRWMADRAGLALLDVAFNDVNGGSFTVAAVPKGSALAARALDLEPLLARERALGLDGEAPYARFRADIGQVREELLGYLETERKAGRRVLGYGASTKGNVLLQHFGLGPEHLACIAEVNAGKFGAFTPGTRIPIVSEADAKALGPDCFLVLPWHFREGILERERAFLDAGGKFLFPLPAVEAVGRA